MIKAGLIAATLTSICALAPNVHAAHVSSAAEHSPIAIGSVGQLTPNPGKGYEVASALTIVRSSQKERAKCADRRQKVIRRAQTQARKKGGKAISAAAIEAEVLRVQKKDGLHCYR